MAEEFNERIYLNARRWTTVRLCSEDDTDELYATSHLPESQKKNPRIGMDQMFTRDECARFQVRSPAPPCCFMLLCACCDTSRAGDEVGGPGRITVY